jgi:hypothetical protein
MAAGFAWKVITFTVVGVHVSYLSCHKLARREKIYQCFVTVVLQPPDLQKRVAYYQWFETSGAQYSNSWNMTLFSNEAWFHLSQYVSYTIHT